jgi:hypothetical protein
LEQLAQTIMTKCKYQDRGCPFKCNDACDTHEAACDYRSLGCGISKNCEWTGCFKDHEQHITEAHKKFATAGVNLGSSSGSFLTCAVNDWDSWSSIKVYHRQDAAGANHKFIRQMNSLGDGCVLLCVQYIGAPSKAKAFEYTTELTSQDRSSSLSVRGQCMSVHVKLSDIVDKGLGFRVHTSSLNALLRDDKKLRGTLLIKEQ